MKTRWIVAGLLFSASVINYIDRQSLSVVAPILTKELHLSPVEYSNILQAFLIPYTLMYAGSGLLVDRWGARVSLAVFMAWWSAANMLHALAGSSLQFGICRALLGIGEPGNFMASIKAVSEWFPAKQKAVANGLVNAGASVGAIAAPPLVVWLTLRYGWRASFVVTGAIGLVWIPLWLYVYRNPPEVAKGPAARVNKLALFRIPQTWGLLIARFISDPVWWFYIFWLPKYLVEQRGFTVQEMGRLAWLPYVFADLGAMAGGFASSWLIRRNVEVFRARRIAMLGCALLMPLSVAIAFTPSRFAALAIICVVLFAHMGWKTNLMTLTNDIYPVGVVGTVSGFVAFGSSFGATIFTNLTGQMVQHFSYGSVFILMGFLHPVSYLVVRKLVKRPAAGERLLLGSANVLGQQTT